MSGPRALQHRSALDPTTGPSADDEPTREVLVAPRLVPQPKLIWWTEGYGRRADAEHAVSLIQRHVAASPLR